MRNPSDWLNYDVQNACNKEVMTI